MKRFTEILSGSAAVLFQVALTGWMFTLSEINFNFAVMELNYLALSAVMLVAYYINMAVMRRGIPVPIFAIIELALVAVGVFVFVKSIYIEPFQLRTVIINCIIYCLGFVAVAYLAWTPTNQNGILLRFDALAVMSLLMIVLDHILDLPAADACLVMCWACLGLTLLAAISMKSGALMGRGSAVEGNGALGRIMLFVVFGFVGLLAFVIVLYAASGFKSFSEFLLGILTAIVGAVKAVLVFLYRLLESFIKWLAQFMEEAPMEALPMEQGAVMDVTVSEEAALTMPGWIYYVLIGIAAAAIVYIIFRLRKYRAVKVVSTARVATRVRRESGLKKALEELWSRLCTEMRYRWNCLRYRRSVAGLLVWCEKRAGESLARHTDESGPRFLLRLSESLGEEALASLAALVERSFYSPVPAAVPTELYRAVKKIKFKVEKTEG